MGLVVVGDLVIGVRVGPVVVGDLVMGVRMGRVVVEDLVMGVAAGVGEGALRLLVLGREWELWR